MQKENKKAEFLRNALIQIRNEGITLNDIIDIISSVNGNEEVESDNRIKVNNLLKEIGVPFEAKTYDYLQEAIIIAGKNRNQITLSRGIYPLVAERFNTTPAKVLTTIRRKVDFTIACGDAEALNKIFGFDIDTQKISTKKFIFAISEYLKLY